MSETNVTFKSGNITLEGIWHEPEGKGIFPAVVVCHPHPLYGGDMWNNVVWMVSRELPRRGLAALRFNFRGVGGSEGDFAEGVGEQADVRGALDFILSSGKVDKAKLGLAGYSFGGGVALSVAVKDTRVKALGLISPGISPDGWRKLGSYPNPRFLITGDTDSSFPLNRILPELEANLKPDEYRVVAGADHFWMGYETEMSGITCDFFAAHLT